MHSHECSFFFVITYMLEKKKSQKQIHYHSVKVRFVPIVLPSVTWDTFSPLSLGSELLDT